jgi:signal transduction histidine kinase
VVLDDLCVFLGADSGFAGVPDLQGAALRISASYGSCGLDAGAGMPLQGKLKEAFESERVVCAESSPHSVASGHPGGGHLLLSAVRVSGEPVGLLGVSRGAAFTDGEEVLLGLVAGELSAAVELSRLRASVGDMDLVVRRRLWEEIGKISSELAHDMRGPLQTVTNSIFLLERKPADKDVYVQKINGALAQATGLLDGFREYYRGHELQTMRGSVSRALEKAVEELQLPEGVRVERSLDAGVPETVFDPGKLKRAFWQIAKNGVEAMPQGGVLRVESRVEGGLIVVRIGDSGSGIQENIREKVFQPFAAKKRGGFGLGLAASRRVIEAHGGSVAFETETGKGTVFTVRLPAAG